MGEQEVQEAMEFVRNDEVDAFTAIETLANIAAALRRARAPRALGRELTAGIEAAGLCAELARESEALRGVHTNHDELGQEIADAAARADAADRDNRGATLRPAYGPAAYDAAAQRVDQLLLGYAGALRMGQGAPPEHTLAPLKAEAIGLAGDLAVAVARERG